jgi:NADH dehydrogenase
VEVVLISRENYVLFTPLLHEVAAGDLDPADIVNPVRKMLRQVQLIQAKSRTSICRRGWCGISWAAAAAARAQLRPPPAGVGSETNYFGMKDVEAVAATMKTLGDAALLRNRMVALLEEAAQETDETRRRRLMTFVVAGGGFAGVETVGAINDFLRETVRYYPELDEAMLRVVLVHPATSCCPSWASLWAAMRRRSCRQRGVELRLGTRVNGYENEAVNVAAG